MSTKSNNARFKVLSTCKLGLLLLLLGIAQLQMVCEVQARQARRYPLAAYNFGSLGAEPLQRQVVLLRKNGYSGIVLNTETKQDSINLAYFVNELKPNRQLRIHAVMVRYNFLDEEAKREKWKCIIDKIGKSKAQLWVIFGKKTDGYDAAYIENKLREISLYAQSKQVQVVLYPHSNCVIASAEEAAKYVQKLHEPNLKLAVHLCHEIRAGNGGRMHEVFENVKPYIAAVTVAGTDSVADFSKPRLMDSSTIKPIGKGNYDLRKFIQPLRQSGYKGVVGFINFKIDEDPDTYLKESMQVWRKLTN